MHCSDESFAVEPARHRLGQTPAVGDAHDGLWLRELHVLPELAAGESRAATLREGEVDLGLGLAGLGEYVSAERQQVAHEALPIVTSRKRAGAAPWPTCIDCMGSPLPHVETPQRRQSSAPQMASQEPQKRGVMPV